MIERKRATGGSPHTLQQLPRLFTPLLLVLLVLLAPLFAAPVAAQSNEKSLSTGEDKPVVADTSISQLKASIESVKQRRETLSRNYEKLADDYESLKSHLDALHDDVPPELGELLRHRRDRLTEIISDNQFNPSLNREITQARLTLLELEDMTGPVQVEEKANEPSEAVIKQKIALVEEQIKELEALRKVFNEATAKSQQYLELLDEHLFWLPNVEPFSWDTLTELADAWVWLLKKVSTTRLIDPNTLSFTEKAKAIGGTVIVILLFSLRRRWKRVLETLAPRIGNVGNDNFGLTLRALLATLMLSLSWALLVAALSIVINDDTAFTKALSVGTRQAAYVIFLLSLLSNICRPNGLGEVHFRWRPETLQAVRIGVPLLLVVLVPATVLTALAESAVAENYRGSLGRIAFIMASIQLAYFAHIVLRTKRKATDQHPPPKWIKVVHPAAVTLPILILALSLAGYHYSALTLEGTLFISVCWILLVVLVYYIALRAVAVNERRMTLARLRAERAAAKAQDESREAAENAGEGVPESLDIPQMDLDDISDQAHALLGMLALFAAVIGLWMLWSNVFPAFNALEDITLWTVAAVDGNPDNATVITMQGVAFALGIAFATFFAARNLPGMLEVAFLSRIEMSPGTGYAITTICRYIIVMVGVAVALGLLGAEWSKLQWLVAALGVGLGFGLQEIVANFISGIMILFERPIRVGDTVTVGDQTGTVSRIRIRATTITGWDRKEQIIPNKTFVTEQLTNWTLSDPITRVIVKVGVAYASDIDQVQQILEEVVLANERVINDPPPAVFCVSFNSSNIQFEVRAFVKSMMDILPLTHELHSSTHQALNAAGVAIAYPQLDMHVRSIPEDLKGLTGPKVDGNGNKDNDSDGNATTKDNRKDEDV